jgi:hypothetical protein
MLFFLICVAAACRDQSRTDFFMNNTSGFFEEIPHDGYSACEQIEIRATYIVPRNPPCKIPANIIAVNPEWMRQMRELCNWRDADDERDIVIGVERIRQARELVQKCCDTKTDGRKAAITALAIMLGILVMGILMYWACLSGRGYVVV